MEERFRGIKREEDLSILNGVAFEKFLCQLYSDLGYQAKVTPASGDFGADLLLEKDGTRIAVQAKQYSSQAGFDAIKEAYFAKSYYKADEAWVVATHGFTPQAMKAAKGCGVELFDGASIEKLISSLTDTPKKRVTTKRKKFKGPRFTFADGPVVMAMESEREAIQELTSMGYGNKDFDIFEECIMKSSKIMEQYHWGEEEVDISETLGIKAIGPQAFCSDVGSIGWAFEPTLPLCKASDIRGVKIPNGVDLIGFRAFYECGLVQIELPDSLKFIGDEAFFNCNIENVVIGGNCVLGNSVFRSCKALKSVNFESGITEIPHSTFEFCRALENVELPDTLLHIGREAFMECGSMKSIVLPKSLKTINPRAFVGCSSIDSIEIPSGVKTVPYYCFSECSGLETVTIQEGVEVIERHAFENCKALCSIDFPSTIKRVNRSAFIGCKSLDHLDIVYELNSLGAEIIDDCYGEDMNIKRLLPNEVNKAVQTVDLKPGLNLITVEGSVFELYNNGESAEGYYCILDGASKRMISEGNVEHFCQIRPHKGQCVYVYGCDGESPQAKAFRKKEEAKDLEKKKQAADLQKSVAIKEEAIKSIEQQISEKTVSSKTLESKLAAMGLLEKRRKGSSFQFEKNQIDKELSGLKADKEEAESEIMKLNERIRSLS